MRFFITLAALSLATGCSGSEPAVVAPAAPAVAPPAAESPAAMPPAAGSMAEVAATGTRFDPPADLAQIPPGAWMCEMGTVHYAALEPADGKCPVCGMALTQQLQGTEE